MHRTPHLRWLLMLILLWQGLAAASMVPQLRTSADAMPPCHAAAAMPMDDAASPRPAHAVLESCCDHGFCATAAFCTACVVPMQVGLGPLPLTAAVPLPPAAAGLVAAPPAHPFRPPIL